MKFLRTPQHLRLMEMLTAARDKLEMTQRELAEAIGERQNFVSKYERGERRLDVFELVVVSRPMGFDWAGAVREIEAEYGPIVNPKKRKPKKAR